MNKGLSKGEIELNKEATRAKNAQVASKGEIVINKN